MKLERIEGQPQVLVCSTCRKEGIGGSVPYIRASTEEVVEPEVWYQDPAFLLNIYCSECAAKLVQEDPTRSVNQFYSDTSGTEIKVLPTAHPMSE